MERGRREGGGPVSSARGSAVREAAERRRAGRGGLGAASAPRSLRRAGAVLGAVCPRGCGPVPGPAPRAEYGASLVPPCGRGDGCERGTRSPQGRDAETSLPPCSAVTVPAQLADAQCCCDGRLWSRAPTGRLGEVGGPGGRHELARQVDPWVCG